MHRHSSQTILNSCMSDVTVVRYVKSSKFFNFSMLRHRQQSLIRSFLPIKLQTTVVIFDGNPQKHCSDPPSFVGEPKKPSLPPSAAALERSMDVSGTFQFCFWVTLLFSFAMLSVCEGPPSNVPSNSVPGPQKPDSSWKPRSWVSPCFPSPPVSPTVRHPLPTVLPGVLSNPPLLSPLIIITYKHPHPHP